MSNQMDSLNVSHKLFGKVINYSLPIIEKILFDPKIELASFRLKEILKILSNQLVINHFGIITDDFKINRNLDYHIWDKFIYDRFVLLDSSGESTKFPTGGEDILLENTE
jgi:hypothetical protein